MPTLAYVANGNALSVIDTSTNTVIDAITVNSPGDFIKKIAITPDGRFAYVTNLSNTVSVIDICTNTVVDNITVGNFPVGIAITPDGRFAYVAISDLQTSLSGTVTVIDTSTNTVVYKILVGRDPIGLAITPDGNFAYVTTAFDTVYVIDITTNTVTDTVAVGFFPVDVAITPTGDFAYVTNFGDDSVSVVDTNTNTVVDTIPVGDAPLGIAIANIECPTTSDRMCIETTRIFDSCIFEQEQQKTFKIPHLIKDQDIECEIIETECRILDITKINEQTDLADVKLQIKVFVRFTSKCFDDDEFKKVLSFDKNVTLVVPEGANVSCDINNVTCECIETCGVSCSHESSDKICCTVKVAAVVKSKKLIQIEVPFLGECEPRQCTPYEGIPIAPGKSYPLPNEPSEINRIIFTAKTKPGTTSKFVAFLNVMPFSFATITEELKPFTINLPGGMYPIENISLKNSGKSTIYVYKLISE